MTSVETVIFESLHRSMQFRVPRLSLTGGTEAGGPGQIPPAS